MTWWMWLTGLAEFAVAWWATDALTSPQARAKRVAQRVKGEEIEQASYVPGRLYESLLDHMDTQRNMLRMQQNDMQRQIAKLQEELLTETAKLG